MLDLSAAIDAICLHLEVRGFVIQERDEGNPNIVAVKGDRRLLIKVTGQTNPAGETFNTSQVKAHVSRIVYDALKLTETKSPTEEVWLAVPSDDQHRRRLIDIAHSLRKLGVEVAWVSEDGSVSPFA